MSGVWVGGFGSVITSRIYSVLGCNVYNYGGRESAGCGSDALDLRRRFLILPSSSSFRQLLRAGNGVKRGGMWWGEQLTGFSQ